MRAEIQKINSITVVGLKGLISFETIDFFRKHCTEKLKGEKVVFDMEDLGFVGSTGIASFFEFIRDILENQIFEIKFCNVKIEFQRIFDAWFTSQIEIYDHQKLAIQAFLVPGSVPCIKSKDLIEKEDSSSEETLGSKAEII